MDLRLQGKVAIVTGGSLGIGRTTALALAQEGVDVAICARGVETLEEAAGEIRSRTGRKVHAVRADMTSLEDIQNLVSSAVAELGGVDILVNNAVNSVAAPFMELSDEAWLNHINVKVMGYMRCAREVVPHMKARGGGRIINIGGMAARNVGPLTMSNGVTNSAVSNMAKYLSDQVAQDGILVNCIHPGTTRTPRQTMMLERRASDADVTLEEAERRAVSAIPIGRMVEPEDVADLVLFLVSARASAITGQTIAIEGARARECTTRPPTCRPRECLWGAYGCKASHFVSSLFSCRSLPSSSWPAPRGGRRIPQRPGQVPPLPPPAQPSPRPSQPLPVNQCELLG